MGRLVCKSKKRPKYPNEQVVRFVFKNLKPGQKVLDLGCGAGRHVVFLAENGFESFGLDFSELAINKVKEWLKDLGLCAECRVATAEKLPFEDNFFDALITWGSIYYGDEAELRERISEIHRVLKPGGIALVSLRSVDDSRFGTGAQLEPYTFVVQEADPNKSAFEENGMKMHFFDKPEIQTMFAQFSSITIDSFIVTQENGAYRDDEYMVVLRK